MIPSPNASSEGDDLYSVTAISTNDVWAVGYFENNAQTLILPLLEHWNGKSWSVAPSPDMNPQKDNPNTLFAAIAVSPGNVMTVWEPGIVSRKAILVIAR